ncbi:hypothetical protein PGB90_004314 [Kerria lacca]
MRYAQLVVGPAGSGKSTYCSTMVQQGEIENKTIHVVNLDPAAEYFEYNPLIDIRELIHVDDAMEDDEMQFGPNGGLIFCMEYLTENLEWLKKELGDDDDDFILFDCPGQIELYTHMDVIKKIAEFLKKENFMLCSVFLIDSQFIIDGAKFLSGVMAALSVMINLELPHVNILSKIDLVSKSTRKQLESFLEPDPHILLSSVNTGSRWSKKYTKLSKALGNIIENFSLVKFYPLDIKDEESVADIFLTINNIIQYGEDADTKAKDVDLFENREDSFG